MSGNFAAQDLIGMLHEAAARELQVSVQHRVGAGKAPAGWGTPKPSAPDFVASHTMYFLPGDRIRKTAITEMRHAKAMIEHIARLGARRHSVIYADN